MKVLTFVSFLLQLLVCATVDVISTESIYDLTNASSSIKPTEAVTTKPTSMAMSSAVGYTTSWPETTTLTTGPRSTTEAVDDISAACLKCICKTIGCESLIGKCLKTNGRVACGPYMIGKKYWTSCGRPGKDFKKCTSQMACSETCVRKYTKKYGVRCARGRKPTCMDQARVHVGGKDGCRKSKTVGFWNKVNRCLGQ